MTLSAALVLLIVTVIIPLVTSTVTKSSAKVGIKQFVTAALSAVTGFIYTATQLDGTAVFSKQSAIVALVTFILTQATYLGFWKPHAVNDKIAPASGIG